MNREAIEHDIDILNTVKRADDATRARQAEERDAVAAMVRRQQGAWVEQQRDAETARIERERKATEAHLERQRKQAQAGQQAQAEWAKVRADLRDSCAELSRQLASAESRMGSSDLDEAVRASAEVGVFRMRLERAQQAYAGHCQRSPL